MSSDVSFAQVKQFPPLMWILLFGSFITRGSFYMVWPFLAVILYEKFGLSATEVGSICNTTKGNIMKNSVCHGSGVNIITGGGHFGGNELYR